MVKERDNELSDLKCAISKHLKLTNDIPTTAAHNTRYLDSDMTDIQGDINVKRSKYSKMFKKVDIILIFRV